MEFKNPYWTSADKISMLSRWVLVHSYLYYEMDHSIVSDDLFDKNCMQLLRLLELNREAFRRSRYYYAMKGFDGSTGFGYFQKLNVKDQDLIKRDAANLRDGVIR